MKKFNSPVPKTNENEPQGDCEEQVMFSPYKTGIFQRPSLDHYTVEAVSTESVELLTPVTVSSGGRSGGGGAHFEFPSKHISRTNREDDDTFDLEGGKAEGDDGDSSDAEEEEKDGGGSCEGGSPIPKDKRRWKAPHYVVMWAALSISIPSYMLTSALLVQGFNWYQCLLCLFIGNMITYAIVVITSFGATKYGLSFPLIARGIFGWYGSKFATLLRAVVNVGFFAFESTVGGQCLFMAFVALWPSLANMWAIPFIGMNPLLFGCFVAFVVMNTILPLLGGADRVKHLESIGAPILIVASLALMAWVVFGVGFFQSLEATYRFSEEKGDQGILSVLFNLTTVIGNWSAMILNTCDFARYARSQKDQIVGQLAGLPFVMTAFAFMTICATGAGLVQYGEALWSPVDLVSHFDSRIAQFVAALVLTFGVICSNVAGNLVSAAQDLSNLKESIFTFTRSYIIVAILCIVMLPHKLFGHSERYLVWLVVSSSICSSLTAAMLFHFFVIHRLKVDVKKLTSYKNCESKVNWKTIFVVTISTVIPTVPGMLHEFDIIEYIPSLVYDMYKMAYFVSFIIGIVLYAILESSEHLFYKIRKSHYSKKDKMSGIDFERISTTDDEISDGDYFAHHHQNDTDYEDHVEDDTHSDDI